MYSEFQNVNKTSNSWIDGNGFKDNRTINSYPYSASLPGIKNSLEVLMHTNESEIDYKCSGFLQGFKVSIIISFAML